MKCRWCGGKYDPRLEAVHEATLKHRVVKPVVQFLGTMFWA